MYKPNSEMRYSDVLIIKSYDKDKLSKIVNNSFRVDSVFQDSYEGINKTESHQKLAKIAIDNTPGKETQQLILNDKMLLSYSTFDYESAISFPKNTQNIYYFESNNSIIAKKVNFGNIDSEKGDGDDWQLLTAFFGLVINNSGNVLEIFKTLTEDLSAVIIATIDLNPEGKPQMGIVIEKIKTNYTLKTYFYQQLLSEKNNISFGNLKKECEKMNKLLNDKLNNRNN